MNYATTVYKKKKEKKRNKEEKEEKREADIKKQIEISIDGRMHQKINMYQRAHPLDIVLKNQ